MLSNKMGTELSMSARKAAKGSIAIIRNGHFAFCTKRCWGIKTFKTNNQSMGDALIVAKAWVTDAS
ncbi:MAG: hypothetical protein DHS20C20_03050 [Ardenticatenaceae bacterium]|nr:MAG: hypothetical protein DHS20C20_03050 [Ardenticatenaceae bacterium]